MKTTLPVRTWFLALAMPACLIAAPGTGVRLDLIRGKTHAIATVAELKAAVEAANRDKIPATLLLADGTYRLDVPALDILCPGLVIRSAGGDRDAVIVRGPDEGPSAAVANVFLVSANDVVIADLTLGYCRYHGIQVRGESPFDVSGLLVHNCRLVNCNQQFIKGSSSETDPVGATDGRIEQCLFEFTSGWAYQSYTGGIDIHKGVNWTVCDNLFRNIRTPPGEQGIAEHAIHFWKRCPTRSQNITVERNWVVNCDRGIGFGLGSLDGGLQGGTSAIRNNMVSNDGSGPHTDVGIGLEYADSVHVDNNTVVVQKYWGPMEYRFAGSSNLVFRNNLANRPIQRRDGAPEALMINNLEQVDLAWFKDFASGDLRLTEKATPAIDAGRAVAGFGDDVDHRPRPQGAQWDIGAFEYGNLRAEVSEPALADSLHGLKLVAGPVNGAIIERGGKVLAVYGDPSGHLTNAEILLLTEARRDVTWAARDLALHGAEIVAPEKEAEWLGHPEKFWAQMREERFHDYAQQSTRLPVEPIPVGRRVKEGDVIAWRDLSIRVIDTPGYTRGAVSYLVELEGVKVAFTGDLIRDDGKVQDLFSLQDAIPAAKVGGYHGWAGRLGDLVASLDKVAAQKPDLLVPLRGPIIRDPSAAIDRLRDRIRAVYANYLSIDALRWYFKDEHILAKARRVMEVDSLQESDVRGSEVAATDSKLLVMPMAETLQLPQEIIAISNSRLILAADGSGFLIDCGGNGIVDQLRKLRDAGTLTSVEHVFVTHYHDDHTDALPKLVAEFGANVHACGSLVDLIERPGDYRLPCLTRNPTPVTARHRDRDAWRWKEYKMTISDFPGQTLHHNALLVEKDRGWCAFFAGDSFTPSGIDDYCLQNRNFLSDGQGFFRCLDQIEMLPGGCLVINQHVEPAFRFSADQITRMRQTLHDRIPLLKGLLPFDDPNFGLDDSWAAFSPYWVTVHPGDTAQVALRIMNHSPREQTFRATIHATGGLRSSGTETIGIPARTEQVIEITVPIPSNLRPGLQFLVADLGWGSCELREWTEGILEVVQ